MKKSSLIITLVLLLALSSPIFAESLNVTTGVNINFNNQQINPTDANGKPVEAFINSGTTYLPIRALSEAFGVGVNWDANTQTVNLGGVADKPTTQAFNWVGVYKETYNKSEEALSEKAYPEKIKSTNDIPYIEINADGTFKYILNWYYYNTTTTGTWTTVSDNRIKLNIKGDNDYISDIEFERKSDNEINLKTNYYIQTDNEVSTSAYDDIYTRVATNKSTQTAKTINVSKNAKININGKAFKPTDAKGNHVDILVYNGTTYLPVRSISDAFGVKVNWDSSTQTVKLEGTPKLDVKVDTPNEKEKWVGKYTEYFTYGYGTKELSTNLYEKQNIPTLNLKENGTFEYITNWYYTMYTFTGSWKVDSQNNNKILLKPDSKQINQTITFERKSDEGITLMDPKVIESGEQSTSVMGDLYKKN